MIGFERGTLYPAALGKSIMLFAECLLIFSQASEAFGFASRRYTLMRPGEIFRL